MATMSSRILVVTDDTSLQRLLQNAVSGDGHEILIVSFGSDAYRRWSVERADLVILDANVAGVDAFELVVRMRASELPGEHTPIVMVGGAGPQLKVQGLRSGADGYLAMPIHPAELVARVRRLLSRFARKPDVPGPRGPNRAQVLALYGAKGGVAPRPWPSTSRSRSTRSSADAWHWSTPTSSSATTGCS